MKRLFKAPSNWLGVLFFLFLFVFPLFFKLYQVDTMAKYICLALFAISVDLLWGYTGVMSFGQSVFFGLGAYIAALSFSLKGGIPDFMSRYGVESIPGFLSPLTSSIAGIILAIAIPAFLGFILGKLILVNKIKGVFVTLITMAISTTAETALTNSQKYTGGSNGIGSVGRLELFGHTLDLAENYYFVLIILLVAYILCSMLVKSKFGRVLQGIKENETRLDFLGYKTSNCKVFVYILTGAIAALAGVLYVRTVGFVSPSLAGVSMSTNVIVWVAVGGRGNLVGALIGSMAVNWAESIFSGIIPDYWTIIIGLLLLVVVLVIPDGFIGKIDSLFKSKMSKRIETEVSYE